MGYFWWGVWIFSAGRICGVHGASRVASNRHTPLSERGAFFIESRIAAEAQRRAQAEVSRRLEEATQQKLRAEVRNRLTFESCWQQRIGEFLRWVYRVDRSRGG